MELKRFEIFKNQDQENGYFDCTLIIDGKKLFVHKYFLASASEVFSVMLSDQWNKNDELKIENPDYSYENFYHFITFIYSGTCNLDAENIFVLTDMAEFFHVESLKILCDEFLSNMNFDAGNIVQAFEFAQKYSLEKFENSLKNFIRYNYGDILQTEAFLGFKKSFVEFMSTICKYDM
uniref:BTB domain-containing protein n=1 Tax=Panagrolaimus superbus TaxID=310955 RepID=A0A914YR65_9BILA